jgi:tetratricopeptide (TPR) repeat protein
MRPISAVSYYRTAIEHKPDFVYALTNLSAVYASKQQYDSALFFLNRSFTADSINPMTLTNLVVIHSIRGEDSLVVKYAQVADRNHQMSDKISLIYQESIRKIKGKGN